MRARSIVIALLAAFFGTSAPAGDLDPAAIRRAEREAKDLIGKIGAEKDEGKRAVLEARFDALDARARVSALLDGLGRSRPGSQRFAISRIRALGAPELVPHLVLTATGGAKAEVRDDAHGAACALEIDRARRWYEHIAARDFGVRRLRALEWLEAIASPDSVPLLAHIAAIATLEVNVQLAALCGFESVPVNLGSASPAGTQVPIQTPKIDLIEVQTSVKVPAALATGWRDAAFRGLRAIVGSDLGSDPEAYRSWHRERASRAK